MPERLIPVTKCDITWALQDAGAAHTYSPPAELGDFAYAAPLYDLTRILNRCSLYEVRKGNEQPLTVTFTSHLTDLGSSTYATLPDICEEKGYVAANWTSTRASSTEVLCFDQVLVVDGASFGIPDHTLTFPDMVFRGAATVGGDPGSYAVTGESATAIKPTVS